MDTRHDTLPHRRGFALVAVLLVIALIAAVIFEFNYDSRVRYQLADNLRASYQALHCAEAGLATATAALSQVDAATPDGEILKVLSGTVPVPLGEDYFTVSVAAETGKINVNGLKTPEGQLVRPRIDQMLRLIDVLNSQHDERNPLRYSLVPAIIDWIDADDEVTILPFVRGENAGAESDYYQTLTKPYRCKNRPLELLGELTLVKGMSREIFHGAPAAGKTPRMAGMKQFLTVYGDGKLNINEVSVTVLQTFSERMTRALAESVVQHRPYKNVRELSEVPGMTPDVLEEIQELAGVQAGGEYYTVTARGVAGQCVRTLRVVVKRDRRKGRCVPLVRWEL
ncbi:MAG: general secretion pathway protein GspK [Sedimentisphaerales bacterium]|nr:general secretion pathway protein GspK [Sedimentisphaerales bacterium]